MFAALLLLAAAVPDAAPVAALRLSRDGATIRASISEDRQVGYRIRFRCTEGCSHPFDITETSGDTPMGLFAANDSDDLVYAPAGAGSAYRVRVWKVTATGVQRLAEISSRSWPDFLTGKSGAPVIRTSEGESGVGKWMRIDWVYRGGKFTRVSAR